MAGKYKLEFYVPAAHAEKVKKAVFEAGGGNYGLYDRCCWQTAGTGQFRPLRGARPHTGSVGATEKVREMKVEMIVPARSIRKAVEALLTSHPYETPAYQYWKVN